MSKQARELFARAVANTVWCIEPGYLAALMARVEAAGPEHAEAIAKEASAMLEAKAVHPNTVNAVARRDGNAAIVNIQGVLSPTPPSFFDEIFGITRANPADIAAQIKQAAADDSVKVIVLMVDCPGGNAIGLSEAFDAIMSARGSKPIVACITGVCASGGYWITAGADEIYSLEASMVGSIGVFQEVTDYSKMNEESGIKDEYISDVPDKVEGMGHIPLTEEARAHRQEQVMAVSQSFLGDLKAGRGRDMDVAGRGRVYIGVKAQERGLIDGIATPSATLARYNAQPAPPVRGRDTSRARMLALAEAEMSAVDRERKS